MRTFAIPSTPHSRPLQFCVWARFSRLVPRFRGLVMHGLHPCIFADSIVFVPFLCFFLCCMHWRRFALTYSHTSQCLCSCVCLYLVHPVHCVALVYSALLLLYFLQSTAPFSTFTSLRRSCPLTHSCISRLSRIHCGHTHEHDYSIMPHLVTVVSLLSQSLPHVADRFDSPSCDDTPRCLPHKYIFRNQKYTRSMHARKTMHKDCVYQRQRGGPFVWMRSVFLACLGYLCFAGIQ